MKRIVSALSAILFSSVILCGCLPRGETQTLDQIYSEAHTAYMAASPLQVPGDLAQTVSTLNSKLQALVDGNAKNFRDDTKEIAQILADITPRTGFTSRAAFGEISSQYRLFEPSASVDQTSAKVKLLVARTYSMLTGELQTTRFGL